MNYSLKAVKKSIRNKKVKIVFTKKDGSTRTLYHVPTTEGLAVSKTPSAEQAVRTRKRNNPGLLSVFDSQLYNAGTPANQCWRSVNYETIKTFVVS